MNTPNPVPVKELRDLLAAVKTLPWKCGRPDMTSYDADTGEPFKQVYEAAEGGGPVLRGVGENCHKNAQLATALVNHADALLCAEERAQRAEREVAEALYRSQRHAAECEAAVAKAEARLAAQVEMSARLAGNLRGYVEHHLTGQDAHTRHDRARDALNAYDKTLSSPGKEA